MKKSKKWQVLVIVLLLLVIVLQALPFHTVQRSEILEHGERQMIEEKYSFFNVDIAMHYFLAPLISGIATILTLLLSILSVIGKVEQRKKGLWEGICLFLATAGAGFTWILAGTPLTGVVTGLLLCTIMAYIACIKNLGNRG